MIEGVVDIGYLDFRKAYDIVSQKIFQRETDEVWAGWANSEVNWKLAKQLNLENGDWQYKV